MSKSVLISIKPQWCKLIANSKKTIEVRKSRPKIETPFKCYIYCSLNGSKEFFQSMKAEFGDTYALTKWNSGDWGNRKGKVIAEFICDKIYQYSTGNVDGVDISDEDMIRFSCLSKKELCAYEMSAEPKENCVYLIGLYGWHISDLKIYDEPKELSAFSGLRKTKFGYEPVEIKRPPQSWCYVEEAQE